MFVEVKDLEIGDLTNAVIETKVNGTDQKLFSSIKWEAAKSRFRCELVLPTRPLPWALNMIY